MEEGITSTHVVFNLQIKSVIINLTIFILKENKNSEMIIKLKNITQSNNYMVLFCCREITILNIQNVIVMVADGESKYQRNQTPVRVEHHVLLSGAKVVVSY